jgi:DNA invertase Pin-like site-specific DNA recombinase
MTTPAVLYLWAPNDAVRLLQRAHEDQCRRYAKRQGWEVVDIIHETGPDPHSAHRDGLQQVYHVLRSGRAEIVLTTSRRMLGDEETYSDIAQIIESKECAGTIRLATPG